MNSISTRANERSPGLSPRSYSAFASRRAWILLWVIFAILESLLLANNAAADTWSWRATRWFMGDQDAYKWAAYKSEHASDPQPAFYQRNDPPMTRQIDGLPVARLYTRTEKIWRLFRDLGEPYLTVILLTAVILYDRRRWWAGAMLLAGTCAAGGMGALIRMTAGRFRPIEADGLNHWELWRGFHDGRDLSFPSGHATLAFATAAVLTYLSPRGRCLFLTLATGCAIARVVMQAHFWSDVLFGSVLGWSIGWFVSVTLDQLLSRRMSQSSAANSPTL